MRSHVARRRARGALETTTVSRGGNISRLDASRDLSRWFARDARGADGSDYYSITFVEGVDNAEGGG
jgi:hypothetical protein